MTKASDEVAPYLLAAKWTTPAYERRMVEDLESWNPSLAMKVRKALDESRRVPRRVEIGPDE